MYANMFPSLEKAGIGLTAKFQRRSDGWIPHFFPGTFRRIDEYRRKDMNMQFVLMAYRDAFLWNDRTFAGQMYPAVKRAMRGAYRWDTNGDGIPEVEGKAQTFDAWGFTGTSIYLATLWLGALKACAAMAKKAGDTLFAKRCLKDSATVRERIISAFYNGEYFILAVDGESKDECCLIDALSGDWYCRLSGLGGILDDALVKSHLRACFKYNRKKIDPSYMKAYYTPGEKGFCYINGGYPDGRRVCFQQYEPWTGLEYTLALHCALMGMKREAMQVVKDVYDRKMSCGQHWNHIECGGEYFRPMVIGALWELLAQKNI
jgi:uncharacterized protein (DUF608 family)